METVILVAFALLAFGVIASVLPVVPAGGISLAGVLTYWWATGRPGPILLGALVVTALLALVVDWLAAIAGAKAGGASFRTSLLAAAVGMALIVPLGPIGPVLGIGGTVFVLELKRGATKEASLRAAGYAVLGVLGSAFVQALLTGSILVAVVLVYL